MSVEEQRAYVQAVDQAKATLRDLVADMISSHSQIKQAAAHNNMLGVVNGIEVLQRYSIVVNSVIRSFPPTPRLTSDFQEPVEYPTVNTTQNPTDTNLPKELHINKDELKAAGIEDLSEVGPTVEETRAVFTREPPQKPLRKKVQ